MCGVTLKLVKEHEVQNKNIDVKKELKSIQDYIDEIPSNLKENAFHMLIIKGLYDDFTKRMTAALVFINSTGKTINEMHGVLCLKSNEPGINIAKTTINFDKEFMGTLENRKAILVHFNIPVKGISTDREFSIKDLESEFSDVRVTYEEENENE